MIWLATPSGARRQSFSKRPFGAAACPQARFDGGHEDPRALVAEYQVLMRADLFTDLAEECAEERRPPRWQAALAACQEAFASCEDGLRWLWLAPPRRANGPLPIATSREIDDMPATVESIDPAGPAPMAARSIEPPSQGASLAARSRPSSVSPADDLATRPLPLAA